MFVIKLPKSHPLCYYDGSDGDPGRTTRIEKARVYKNFVDAQYMRAKLKQDYPNRSFEIENLGVKNGS